MAGYSVQQILAPQSILRTISRLALPGTSLSQLFGWNIGNGPIPGALLGIGNEQEGNNTTQRGNYEDWDLRVGQYDIFDVTRTIATASLPSSAPTRVKPQKVGSVQVTLPRANERITLDHESIHNRRTLGGAANMVDRGGQRYIAAQQRYMAARFANLIEFQTAAMLRGSYSFTMDGDRMLHSFSGGEITIDYKRPAGNLNQLNMTGAGNIIDASWATSSTDIPKHLYQINDAMINLTGMGLEHVVVTSVMWNNIMNNTKVHTQGGSSQRVFDELSRTSEGEFTAVLRNIPWVTWHIVDYGLELEATNGTLTYTKMIEDTAAVFLPKVSDSWATYIRGGEFVTEGPNGTQDFRRGFYAYSYPEYEPSGVNMVAIHNGLPANPVPKAIAYGTVVF